MDIKLRLGADTRLVSVPFATKSIIEAVAAKTFGVPVDVVRLLQTDADGDAVSISSDADVERAIDKQRTGGRIVPILTVIVPAGTEIATLHAARGSEAPAKKSASMFALHRWSDSQAIVFMRICNLLNGCALAAGAVGSFFIPETEAIGLGRFVLAMYLIFFGLTLICAELNILMWQRFVRRNFGYMFSYIGRPLYIFFAATVCIAVSADSGSDSQALFIAIASMTLINALLNFIIIFTHPIFSRLNKEEDEDATKDVIAWLAAHPDVVLRASNAAGNPWVPNSAGMSAAATALGAGVTVVVNPFGADSGLGGGEGPAMKPSSTSSAPDLNPFNAAIAANARAQAAAVIAPGLVQGAVRDWNTRASFSATSKSGSNAGGARSPNAFLDVPVL